MNRILGKLSLPILLLALLSAAACGGDADPTSATTPSGRWNSDEPLLIGAIPDQEPQELQRLYGTVAEHLTETLGVSVEYLPVTDYTAAVSLFRAGDLDLVWYGGLTGVQARLQVEGAEAIVQRDIDEAFRSVFIAGAGTGIEPFADTSGLEALAGTRFTFGSESSTSGRLMPQYFLSEAGLGLDDFDGEVGFSGDHDKTIDLVEAGTYETGALNVQVWDSRLAEDAVDTSKVVELFRTPTYHDYHWVIHPEVEERYGDGFTDAVVDAFVDLDATDAEQKAILDLFGAGAFIATSNDNYSQIEQVARDSGLIE